jgi:hypothetical protein
MAVKVAKAIVIKPRFHPGIFFWQDYDLGVDSVSIRNEYKESSLAVKGGGRLRLTTSPHL